MHDSELWPELTDFCKSNLPQFLKIESSSNTEGTYMPSDLPYPPQPILLRRLFVILQPRWEAFVEDNALSFSAILKVPHGIWPYFYLMAGVTNQL